MMASWAATTFHSNQLLPMCAVVTNAAAAPNCNCKTNFSKVYICSRRRLFGLHIGREEMKFHMLAVKPRGDSSLQTRNQGAWEEPDDGSGSDYDEEEEGSEVDDADFESDWEPEEANASVSAVDEYENFVKEVEELLLPEERAILHQNTAPDLGKISTEKWTSLHTLALSGQIHFMDNLLENGLDIDMVDKDGLTALHKAIIGKKEAVISHLLRKGANPHVKDLDGATPLHYAVQVGALQTVKLLIKYKVDVNVADNEGWTPLHIAMQTRSRDIGKVLLVNGADKTRKNKDGNTPLDLSLCYGKDFKSYELAKLLKLVPANRDF